MRVGLIEVIDRTRHVQCARMPQGLAHLAAYLKRKAGCDVVFSRDPEELMGKGADLVGISCVSQNYPRACRIAASLRDELGVPIIVGGPHITALPESLDRAMDAGVIGEGEVAFARLLDVVQTRGTLPLQELERVPGLVFRKAAGNIVRTKEAPPVELDGLPLPDFDAMLPDYPDRAQADEVCFVASRGCPFRCTFCATAHDWRRYRHFSPAYIVRFLRVQPRGITHVTFQDSYFCTGPSFLEALERELEGSGLLGSLTFHISLRAELATEEVLRRLHRIGVRSVSFGAESGSDRVLRGLKGNSCSVALNQRCIDRCRNVGLSVIPSFIIGAPGEREKDLEATLQFIDSNCEKMAYFEFYPAVPYPQTPFWRHAASKGLVSDDMDWSRLDIDYLRLDTSRYIYLNEGSMAVETFWRGYCEMLMRYARIQQRNADYALRAAAHRRTLHSA